MRCTHMAATCEWCMCCMCGVLSWSLNMLTPHHNIYWICISKQKHCQPLRPNRRATVGDTTPDELKFKTCSFEMTQVWDSDEILWEIEMKSETRVELRASRWDMLPAEPESNLLDCPPPPNTPTLPTEPTQSQHYSSSFELNNCEIPPQLVATFRV